MGMEMKSKAGKWVMADDPAFEPIYGDIASHNRTLIAHLAEPDSCWKPPNAASPDYSYYKEHPGEYGLHASRVAIKGSDPCGARSPAGRESQAARHRRTPR